VNGKHIIVRKDGRVLARLLSPRGDAPRQVFWQSETDAELTAYRYAVQYPSRCAAARGAEIYDGEARELVT
jgi:hypothetical protein